MEYMRIYGMSAIIKEKLVPNIFIWNDYTDFYEEGLPSCQIAEFFLNCFWGRRLWRFI